MPSSFAYGLDTSTPLNGSGADAEQLLTRPYAGQTDLAFLGFGLVAPLMRDQRGDFVAAGEAALVASCVAEVLGTACSGQGHIGELPWRPEFGSLLYTLRHQNNDSVLEALARVHVIEALRRWEPRALVTHVKVSREESSPGSGPTVLRVKTYFDVIRANVPGNQVLVRNLSVETPVG